MRDEICRVGLSMFQRGLTFGSTGNISARLSDGGWLMTPTNASLGALDPARLSRFDAAGRLVDGDPATKEAFLHFCMYGQRTRRRRGRASPCDSFRRGEPSRRRRSRRCPAAAHRLFRHAGRPAAAGALLSARRRGARQERSRSSPGAITRCCSPITGRSSPARRSPMRNSPPRSSRKPPNCS